MINNLVGGEKKKKLEREGESDVTINTVSERNTNREIKKN